MKPRGETKGEVKRFKGGLRGHLRRAVENDVANAKYVVAKVRAAIVEAEGKLPAALEVQGAADARLVRLNKDYPAIPGEDLREEEE